MPVGGQGVVWLAERPVEVDGGAEGENAQAIPRRHSCEGEDLSPPLRWSNLPEGTRSLALVVDDPDAPGGVFTQWVAWSLDPGAEGLGEGESVLREGRNGFGTTGYRGPCPPPGHGRHRYVFRLYALDAEPELAPARRRPSWSGRSKGTC
jgi:Raf kinase inhibitor-like YbhB/YbcL family protein